ncbi:hypothetical protein AKJ09_05939 [Labilithrix luteola]|uniref:Lipoprotein n=1 Tax=Labilithrix luteola TaxID=1391654 RepID=A0A0K1Q0H9_9BACT|nr:hypothetical protein [Labilithrix luteola]AKU99275.1 hypothetical protein AKJ09_05939 [Labilithrix luteola]
MRRSRAAFVAFALLGLGPLTLIVGCGSTGLLQGEDYAPDGAILQAAPTDRDALRDAACGDDCNDAGEASAPVPVGDGSALPSNTCETAREIGSLAGDQPGAILKTQGTCSEWLRFRATEENSGALGAAMKIAVSLVPQGNDFDLYGYVDPNRDQLVCATPTARSETLGSSTNEAIILTWGEGTVANGADDSRNVGLLVYSPYGPCPASAGWSLTIQAIP